ncbi:dual specificity protein phosphatase [Anaeramoeba flamelloides]|uniref:Dual specificity protein phosphatase n=1 Tax=Anaeramoeba flamelloides TaxID=1746091 RepID=A0ABQ8YS99_9EUKA|nr:dual specificity protein phosphatase [Anaeramoeba flamelloides]
MLDTYQAFILPHFPKVIDFIQKALLNENVIFVHCMAGISRSSTAILSYIMKIQNMSTWDSIRYLQTKRKMIQPNKSFVFQLQNWYKMGFKLEGESKMHLKYNLMRLENQAFKIIKKLDVWGEEETLYSSLITVVEVLSKEKFFFNQGSFQVLKNLSEQKNDYVYNLFCDCIELRYYPLIINHSWESDPFYTHFIKPLNIYLTKIQNLSLN